MVRVAFAALLLGGALAAVDNAPQQIHIAFAGGDVTHAPSGMAVSWQTDEGTPSMVSYGTASGELFLEATGPNGTTYLETYTHHVVLEDLKPSTVYYYTVGDGASSSAEMNFTSALPDGATSTKFAVFGDHGLHNGNTTINYLKSIAGEIDFISLIGDASYADDSYLHFGCYTRFCYEDVLNGYLRAMEPIISRVPFMLAPGNHEGECHSPHCILARKKIRALGNFSAYNARYRLPSAESGGSANMFYSYNAGPVHYVYIDTESSSFSDKLACVFTRCGGFMTPDGRDILAWLESDLAEADTHRDVRPWIVVQGHRPIYSGNLVDGRLQDAVEGMLRTHGVDVYFGAHVHSYERDYPVFNSEPTPNATTHIMIGGSGNDEMHGTKRRRLSYEAAEAAGIARDGYAKEYWELAHGYGVVEGEEEIFEKPIFAPPAWTAVTDTGHYGIGRVHANMTHFAFEYVRTTDGEVFDSVTLAK